MNYTIKNISHIINGNLSGQDFDSTIQYLLIDSRKITHAETSLFFAIKGERHDGHQFLTDLYERGVRNFVVSDKIEEPKFQADRKSVV